MPKPTVIDVPFPTVEEVARIYGISAAERKRIVRSLEEFLKHDAPSRTGVPRTPQKSVARKSAARKLRKK